MAKTHYWAVIKKKLAASNLRGRTMIRVDGGYPELEAQGTESFYLYLSDARDDEKVQGLLKTLGLDPSIMRGVGGTYGFRITFTMDKETRAKIEA